MQRLLPLFAGALLAVLPARAAPAPESDGDRTTLPEDSRWLSFVRLVDARWRVRTTVLDTDPAALLRQYDQCVEDAWQLAIASLLDSPKAPCARLAAAVKARGEKPKKKRRGREESPAAKYERRFEGAAISPTYAEFRECTDAALLEGGSTTLRACAVALVPRAAVLVSIDDTHRFRSWMDGCKRAMIGPVTPPTAGEKAARAAPPPPTPEADAHARHCLRTLPTLYEIQWLKKLSDFWTPEEQRALQLRSRQLGMAEVD